MSDAEWVYNQIPKFFGYYNDSFFKLKENLGKKRGNGEYLIIKFPCKIQLIISWMIKYLRTEGFDVSDFQNKLQTIEKELKDFRQTNLDIYCDQLLFIFQHKIKYTDVHELFYDPSFFETFLLDRDYLEAIRLELEPLIDMSDDLEQLGRLDDEFRSAIPKMIERRTYVPLDFFYAPPEIWWRHLEEKYGKQKGCPKYYDMPGD